LRIIFSKLTREGWQLPHRGRPLGFEGALKEPEPAIVAGFALGLVLVVVVWMSA